ncbi:MAG: HEAT repeat domain-containing protein [Paludibacteraceae bacterium]|nr:HEAT repeat domain-containing protein [Paludibacteraceae bacterium]
MTDSELYKSLSALTKNKGVWEEQIPYVESLLSADSVKIKSKALWMLGEMGLAFPSSIKNSVDVIASFLDSTEPILRERAINALGRIGRGCFNSVEPYWNDLFRFAHDEDASVRLAFIWASENIATNTPDPYKDHMPLFAELLHDSDDRVRMEAPEIFRVLGKRKPDFVKPYIERLRNIAETDSNRVVKIHCQGAIRAVE